MILQTENRTEKKIHIQRTTLTTATGEKRIHLLLSSTNASIGFRTLLADMLAITDQVAEETGAVVVFQRFIVSNAVRQTPVILQAIGERPGCASSIIQQPPANYSKLAMWVYLSTNTKVSELSDGVFLSETHNSKQIWATGMTASGDDAYSQTQNILQHFINQLDDNGMTLERDCQRTWLFVNDIDNRYAGMVEARNDIFQHEGLTTDTHFISSTGIAGKNALPQSYVMLDAVAYAGLPRERVSYLYASGYMNRTSDYGVRFERGTVIELEDYTQVFISGTASINNKGEVVHIGNVIRQASRMMANIEELLREASCDTSDIQQAIIYLRNISDYKTVAKWFKEHYPNIPRIIVHAPVCRPDWLIEMECMAARERK